jgi:uncharacterized protein YecE (DUF72 family)
VNSPVLRIGTAGWNVPARYAKDMPDAGSHLERYAQRLNAVEINSSFYRPHQRKTYERWARSTPAGFRFSVKIPKTITHESRLADCRELLDRFVTEVTGLGEKLGVLLVQLPPKLEFEKKHVDGFIRDLHDRINTAVAFEPRNASWFAPGRDEWLAERGVALVAADPSLAGVPGKPGGWNGLNYYRKHGSPKIYFSDYDASQLASLKRHLEESRARHIPTWCIFDNTAEGAALGNALAISRE